MNEVIISGKKNGMLVLLALIAVTAISIAVFVTGIILDTDWIMVIAVIWWCTGWILIPGFKVLKPQEALVMTLFGKYIGTLKGEGFYFEIGRAHV